MKTTLLTMTLISSFALAETTTLTIEGMHCSGCKAVIAEKVCTENALKTKYESCAVNVTDGKKEMGQLTIVTKKNVKIDLAEVKAGVQAAGKEYKVIKEEIK